MRSLVLIALRGYKRYLSPVLPSACRYVPTCSDFAMEAVERNGVIRGGTQAIWRFLRCNPFGGHGFDPVQPHVCRFEETTPPKPKEGLDGAPAH